MTRSTSRNGFARPCRATARFRPRREAEKVQELLNCCPDVARVRALDFCDFTVRLALNLGADCPAVRRALVSIEFVRR